MFSTFAFILPHFHYSRGKIKQLLDGKKTRSAEYIIKNAQKKEVHLDIVIDVKYLKGKRGKKGCETLVLLFMELTGLQERLVMSTEDGLLSNRLTG